jgi:hypothetical protein
MNTNARNAAADLFVGSSSRTFLNLLTHFVSVSALLTFDLGARTVIKWIRSRFAALINRSQQNALTSFF